MNDDLDPAAEILMAASSIVVGAGAGIGVDSGLPDFRGAEGFWRAYPPLKRLGLRFEEAANPALFKRNPRLGWGFYGHRALLYRKTAPHEGFRAILDIAAALDLPWFVVTSNVDGQFQKAGYDPGRVYEIHGSIHHLQCYTPCSRDIWKNERNFEVDEEAMEMTTPLPACPRCGGMARPNILMFGDWSWVGDRSGEQAGRYDDFLRNEAGARPVFLEIGAGTGVPSIRREAERVARIGVGRIVRINPREPDARPPHVGLALGAEEALLRLRGRFGD